MSVDIDSGDGQCDVWEESVRRARKPNTCDACGDPIRRGDLYHVTKTLYEGLWRTTDRCARCETMYRFLGTVMPRGDVCHEELDCGHEWDDNFDTPPPPEIAALAFLTADEAQSLFGPGGLRTQIVAEQKRKRSEEHFRAKARCWFQYAGHRVWQRDVLAAQAAEAG